MTDPDIRLHIDTLVLDGLDPMDPAAVGQAVRHELARLLTERGLPTAWQAGATVSQLPGGIVNIPDRATPERVGTAVAGAVYRGPAP